MAGLSPRLRAAVDALPLTSGMRVLEIGCGPGAAAREVSRRIGDGFVLGIDRSAKAIEQALAASCADVASGRLAFRRVAVETFELAAGEPPFDLAFAIRVGALDGRHPDAGRVALDRLAEALTDDAAILVGDAADLVDIRTASRA